MLQSAGKGCWNDIIVDCDWRHVWNGSHFHPIFPFIFVLLPLLCFDSRPVLRLLSEDNAQPSQKALIAPYFHAARKTPHKTSIGKMKLISLITGFALVAEALARKKKKSSSGGKGKSKVWIWAFSSVGTTRMVIVWPLASCFSKSDST